VAANGLTASTSAPSLASTGLSTTVADPNDVSSTSLKAWSRTASTLIERTSAAV
jgi:hypothetical protein